MRIPYKLLACVMAFGLSLTACGKSSDKGTPTTAASSNSPAPPSYTLAQVESALLGPKEIESTMQQTTVAIEALKEKQIPMCSLSNLKPRGKREPIIRQFTNTGGRKFTKNYGQAILRYQNIESANNDFQLIRNKAKACPKKQHVPAKKIPGNLILLEHDDTWKISEDKVGEWIHIRGFEKHVEPPTSTKLNVYFIAYDYAIRGNVIVATLYSQRTSPKDSGKTASDRATEILIKQLQKFD